MELRHLRYFSAVAESKNLTKASAMINVTQPALSRQIKALEDEIGIVLFKRHASGMSLTEGGRVFLKSSQKILSLSDAAIQEANNVGKATKLEFRLGYDASAVSPSLFQALNEFGSSFLELKIDLKEAAPRKLLEQLHSGLIDLAIIPSDVLELSETVHEHRLPKKRMHAMLNSQHRFSKMVQLDLAALSQEPLIVYDSGQFAGSKARAWNACRRAGFDPLETIETTSYSSMIGMIAAGRGFSIYPEDPNLATFRSAVRTIPTFQKWEAPSLSIVWLRDSGQHLRDSFVQCFLATQRAR